MNVVHVNGINLRHILRRVFLDLFCSWKTFQDFVHTVGLIVVLSQSYHTCTFMQETGHKIEAPDVEEKTHVDLWIVFLTAYMHMCTETLNTSPPVQEVACRMEGGKGIRGEVGANVKGTRWCFQDIQSHLAVYMKLRSPWLSLEMATHSRHVLS